MNSDRILSPAKVPSPREESGPRSSKNAFRWSSLPGSCYLLCALCLLWLVYWPALHGDFVWDDFLLLKSNPLVTGQLNLRTVWFQTDFPLSTVAFWLEWLAFGRHPAGYHIVNLALHTLNALLVWRLLAYLKVRGAGLGAALFALHPVCVASVAWISELKNTLSLPFFLLSIWTFLKAEPSPSDFPLRRTPARRAGAASCGMAEAHRTSSFPRRTSPFLLYLLSLLCFVLALLSKTSTVTLPVVLLLCVWWRRARSAGLQPAVSPISNRPAPDPRTGLGNTEPLAASDTPQVANLRDSRLKICATIAPFFALALGFGLLTVWFQSHQAFTTATVQTERFWGRLAGSAWAVWFYLGKALLPLHLNAIYPRWQINPASALAWLPLLALAAVFFLGARSSSVYEERPSTTASWPRNLLFALAGFIVLLFPALGFFDMYFLALSRVGDQFQYLALIPITALVAAALSWTTDHGPRTTDLGPRTADHREALTHHASRIRHHALRFAPLALLLPLAVLTFHRARIWSDNEALWRDTLAKNPRAWTAQNNLGVILAEQRHYDQALTRFAASVQLNPTNADAQANLGQALALEGRFAEAEPHFRTALQLKPESADAQRQFAAALARQGRLPEALDHLRQALRLQPDTALRRQYAALLYQTGNPREAVNQLRLALAGDPNSTETLNNLAWLLATNPDPTLRRGPEAVQFAERACALTQRKQPLFLATLAAAYAEASRFPEAISAAEQARDQARLAQQERIAQQAEALLRLFQAGKPYHEQ